MDGISWPWPRSAYGAAIRFLKSAGASEIVFDMIFTERSVHGLEDDIGFGNVIEDAGVILAKLSSNRQSSMSEKADQKNKLITEKLEVNVKGAD